MSETEGGARSTAASVEEDTNATVVCNSPPCFMHELDPSYLGYLGRDEVRELLEALLARHPHGTVHVAWDNASTHEDEEVAAVLRGTAGRLVLLYLPSYSPWLNPAEMLWRHYRREVTHCELFERRRAPRRHP